MTHAKVTVANPAQPRRSARLTFLVDSGAIYSVVPASTLRRLRIKPHGDSVLLGTVSLEAIGLMLDPIKRRLKPLPMVLG